MSSPDDNKKVEAPSESIPKKTCYYFRRGYCKYGDRCRYAHVPSADTPPCVRRSRFRGRGPGSTNYRPHPQRENYESMGTEPQQPMVATSSVASVASVSMVACVVVVVVAVSVVCAFAGTYFLMR